MNTYKNLKDDALRADWLRDIGLNDKTFDTAKLNVVRAQAMANTLLTQHRALLSNRDIHSLTAFTEAFSNKHERKGITDSFCYCVMNIHTRINRKLFKQHRKLTQSNIMATHT
jgi:hypothetical protein